MIIRMKKTDYDAVVQYCLSGLPNESCGLIAGFVKGDVKSIDKVLQQSRMQEVLA